MAFLIGGTFGFLIMSALLDAMPWNLILKLVNLIIGVVIFIVGFPIACVFYGLSCLFKYILKKMREEPPKEV